MDFKKMYTPAEATTLYNVAKIKFDPTSYSLRGNLITNHTLKELYRAHIESFSYEGEAQLIDAIKSKESRALRPLTGMSGIKVPGKHYATNDGAFLGVRQDSLYVSLECISRLTNLEEVKKSNVMQSIVSMFVALDSPKSCSKELLYLAMHRMNDLPYDNLHNFEYLREALNSKSGELAVLSANCSIDSTYAPTICSGAWHNPHYFETKTLAVGVDTLYSYLINSLEVMWALKNIAPEYQDCILALCRANESTSCSTALFNIFFKLTDIFELSPEVHAAVNIDDPKKRFEAYQNVIKSIANLYNTCKFYYTKEIVEGRLLNPVLTSFVSYITQIGVANTRINTIRILHEYCVAHKYIATYDCDDDDEDDLDASDLMKKFDKAFGGMPTKSDESKSLIDFEKPGKYVKGGEKPEELSEHDTNAMFEALDKVKASFKSGKYRFDVKDITVDDDACRKKYNAIAKKVDLINKLLIKRIRDIKTYNVGGKNPGASSGRLDRKAMYRYKYDSNIFYNNTYKTLESDLAFGIILDESGSMSGSGIENGRITMIVLHETLKALGINHSIIGHTSEGKYHSEISRYQAFQEDKTYNVCKNYGIVKTEAKEGNCDSGALYYMEKALDRVRNKDKICLIFSDGAPTECTGTELKEQVRHMEKKGIKVIGIGINFASIAKYYTDYANGRNLTDMLNIVSKILEEYVLKKKDK